MAVPKFDVLSRSLTTLIDIKCFDNILARINTKAEVPQFNNLVYSVAQDKMQQESIDLIIKLLMQVRTFQNGQNSFVSNASTIKNQITEQLHRELLFAKPYLNFSQINQIKEVIENNTFSKDDFDKLILSLSRNLKKK